MMIYSYNRILSSFFKDYIFRDREVVTTLGTKKSGIQLDAQQSLNLAIMHTHKHTQSYFKIAETKTKRAYKRNS